MDNVTHTLIGITLGHTVPHRNPTFRDAAIWAAVIASNFPDLDFLLKPLTGADNLGYLLQHRGYTHTVLMSVPIALISAWLGGKIGGMDAKSKYWKLLLLVSWIAALLHVVADSWNEYGVHPLWPIDNRWFYGDMIFIIEPLLWFALLPLAVLTARRRWVRGIWIGLGGLLLAVSWIGPFVRWPAALGMTCWAALVSLAQWRFRGVLPAYLAAVAVLVAFSSGSGVARFEALRHLKASAPSETLIQLVSSPAPANPFCWRVIAATRDPSGDYVVRVGAESLAPGLFRPEECEFRPAERMVPLAPVHLPTESHFAWLGEYRGSWRRLERLARENCRFAALLKYARVPFWIDEAGEPSVAGDLRYDNEKGLGFAKVRLGASLGCPRNVPPWAPPIFHPTTR